MAIASPLTTAAGYGFGSVGKGQAAAEDGILQEM